MASKRVSDEKYIKIIARITGEDENTVAIALLQNGGRRDFNTLRYRLHQLTKEE